MIQEQDIRHSDCYEEMRRMPDASIDAIISDPPYGLSREADVREVMRLWCDGKKYQHGHKGFLGKEWDSFVPGPEVWAECCRVLKPGGHLLAFCSTRTWDLMSIAIRMGGFECRDTIGCPTLAWVHGGGMPKSRNIDGGYGTALKPTWEVILMFRKPLTGSVEENMAEHGVGVLNIKDCGIETQDDLGRLNPNKAQTFIFVGGSKAGPTRQYGVAIEEQRRWPSNILLTHHAECEIVRRPVAASQMSLVDVNAESGEEEAWDCHPYCQIRALNEQSEGRGIHGAGSAKPPTVGEYGGTASMFGGKIGHRGTDGQRYGDSGGASRFFYCAKSSKGERENGLRGRIKCVICGELDTETHDRDGQKYICIRNDHPTVKPVDLLRWLIRLAVPQNGLVLDPFCGSGTTLIAAGLEDRRFIGIEREERYVEIATARLAHWLRRDFIEGKQLGLLKY